MEHDDFWVKYPWWHNFQGKWFNLDCLVQYDFHAELDAIHRAMTGRRDGAR